MTGGRVALYDYRDLDDPYEPKARCTFETCTPENFSEILDSIILDGGGDEAESLLSAAVKEMKELKWRLGATKSLVVLTDAPFLTPDRDGTTMQDVIKLSKKIDPVNIYIITPEEILTNHPEIEELAKATDGMAVTELGNLNLLTDYIIDRYDTLPRVEEMEDSDLPTLRVDEVLDFSDKIEVKFQNSGSGVIVVLNESVFGITDDSRVIIKNLDRKIKNELVLIPVSKTRRGERVVIDIAEFIRDRGIPKAPDTGAV